MVKGRHLEPAEEIIRNGFRVKLRIRASIINNSVIREADER